jgi:hypothetical protein
MARTLELGPDTHALDGLATAKLRLWDPWAAMDLFLQAPEIDRSRGNRQNEAAALNNLGHVHAGLGGAWGGVGVLRVGVADLAGGG